MKRFLAILFFIGMLAVTARAADSNITATVYFTNSVGTTNGQKVGIFVNSATPYVWTWTNLTTVSGFYLAATNTPQRSATNFYRTMTNQLSSRLTITYAASNAVTLKSFLNQSLNITNSTGWETNLFTTNIFDLNNNNNSTIAASNGTFTTITLAGVVYPPFTVGGAAATNVFVRSGNGVKSQTNVVGGDYTVMLAAGDAGMLTNLNGGSVTSAVPYNLRTNLTQDGEIHGEVGYLAFKIFQSDGQGVYAPYYQGNGSLLTNISVTSITNGGTMSYSNASVFVPWLKTLFPLASANLTNYGLFPTNHFAATNYVDNATNGLDTTLRTLVSNTTNGLAARIIATNTSLVTQIQNATNSAQLFRDSTNYGEADKRWMLSSANLTNWSLASTNQYVRTNDARTAILSVLTLQTNGGVAGMFLAISNNVAVWSNAPAGGGSGITAVTQLGASNNVVKPLIYQGTNAYSFEAGNNVTVSMTSTSVVVSASGGGGSGTVTNMGNFTAGTIPIAGSANGQSNSLITFSGFTFNFGSNDLTTTRNITSKTNNAKQINVDQGATPLATPALSLAAANGDNVILSGVTGNTPNSSLGADGTAYFGANLTAVGDGAIYGNLQVNGKTTSDGGIDPPYLLLDLHTRAEVKALVLAEVPPEKQNGAADCFLSDVGVRPKRAYYIASEDKFYDMTDKLIPGNVAADADFMAKRAEKRNADKEKRKKIGVPNASAPDAGSSTIK